MLSGDDMLDVEGKEIMIVLVQAAVLATLAGPLSDEGAKSGVHYSPEEWARI